LNPASGWSLASDFLKRLWDSIYSERTGSFENNARAFNRAFAGVDVDKDQCSADNFAITSEEQAFVDAGNKKDFWQSRLDKGDPIAETALSILNNTGWGRVANNRLINFGRFYTNTNIDINEFGVAVMRAHAAAVGNEMIGIRGYLNPWQIANYHHEVGTSYGLPSSYFGGTPFGGTAEANITASIWYNATCEE